MENNHHYDCCVFFTFVSLLFRVLSEWWYKRLRMGKWLKILSLSKVCTKFYPNERLHFETIGEKFCTIDFCSFHPKIHFISTTKMFTFNCFCFECSSALKIFVLLQYFSKFFVYFLLLLTFPKEPNCWNRAVWECKEHVGWIRRMCLIEIKFYFPALSH